MQRKLIGDIFKLVQALGFVSVLFSGAVLADRQVESKAQDAPFEIKTIELFVLSGTPVIRLDQGDYPGVKAVIHVVDEVEQIVDPINARLAQIRGETEAEMERKARVILDPLTGSVEFQTRLQRAYLSKLQAERYQLQSYPAAVVNQGAALVLDGTDFNYVIDLLKSKGVAK